MTKEQIVMELGNVGIALSQIEVKGENNLNLLLASIQTVRNVRNSMKGENNHADHAE
jgi:hypothetical protein